MSERICAIKWAGQPDIQFACDSAYSTPKRGKDKDRLRSEGVYVADDDDRLYTFDADKVTCAACRAANI